MLVKRLALVALLIAPAMACAWAAGRASPRDVDLHRMGWLPSDVYDVGEGLPDPTVNAIAVLRNGQAWIGTMRGLARKSGPRMLAEHGPDGALAGAILDLATTEGGDLLVATDNRGVWRQRKGTWTSLGRPFGNNRVQRLRVFRQGQRERVFAIGGGVAELVGTRWREVPLGPVLRTREQFDIAIEGGQDGAAETMWVASFGPGLSRCDGPARCTVVSIPAPGPRTDEIRTLQLQRQADGRNALWVGMHGGGVARLRDGAWTRWHIGNSGLPSDFVSDLELVAPPGGESEVWAGTRSGLAILRGDDDWTAADPRVALLRERVRTLTRARNAQGVPVLWIGADGGVVRTPLQGPWHLVSTLGKQGNGIWGLRVERGPDANERIWLGSDGDGLARFENGRWQVFGTADGLPSNTIRSIARVADGSPGGTLWIGAWGGQLARLQGSRFQVVPTPWPKPDNEASSIVLAEPDQLWASTRQNGIARWDGRAWQWWPPDAYMPRRIYTAIRHGRDVWFSTADKGLARFRDGQWRFFRDEIGLPADALYDMRLIANAGNPHVLWIGSNRNGLLRVDISNPDRPRRVEVPALPALPVSYVYGVVEDGRGDLLVCTDYGVFSLHREGAGFRATGYHREDGLPHDECNANAMQVDDKGQVWIGTVGGAAVYTPADGRARRPSPLQLTRLLVDGRPADPVAGVLQLPRPDSTLELEYELLTGEKEDDSRYRLTLADGDSEAAGWRAENTHRFARLAAGTQRLRIEAKDAFGIAARPLDLQVEVPQVWWRTPGARALQVLAALAGLWGLLKLRIRQLHVREEQLRAMVQERTAQLQKRESELRNANDELRRLSYTDPLTSLGNRRRLFEALDLHWRDAARRRESLALLLIDLDHFKRFNDAHGHLAGDARLRQVAHLVHSLLPSGASAARYGGEELCVLLPGHDDAAAAKVAARMRQAIAVLPADTALPEIDNIAVTASIGVAACVPGLEQRPDVLVARADRALYAAKAAGRNRVELAPPP